MSQTEQNGNGKTRWLYPSIRRFIVGVVTHYGVFRNARTRDYYLMIFILFVN